MKKHNLKTILKMVVAIATAILGAIGANSCGMLQ